MKTILDQTFAQNFVKDAVCTTNNDVVANLTDSLTQTFWSPEGDQTTGTLEILFSKPVTFDRVLLQENFREGQRVERFVIEAIIDGHWLPVASGTTIGYKRILRTEPVATARLRLRILSARSCPQIGSFGLFKAPEW